MDKLEERDQLYSKNRNNSNNNSVFESPDVEEKCRNNVGAGKVVEGKMVFEMKNFAGGSLTSVSSEGKRLESEEFENISISAVENVPVSAMKKSAKDALEKPNGEDTDVLDKDTEKSEGLKVSGGLHERSSSSFDKFEMAHAVIAEEDIIDGTNNDEPVEKENGHVSESEEEIFDPDTRVAEVKDVKDACFKETGECQRSGSENDIWKIERKKAMQELKKNISMDEACVSQGSEGFSGRVVSIKEHYGHMMEMRRRSECMLGSNCDKPPDNYRKHSSGDLHSRLKTRKLLGVGETDDGDVHRSKLSQILGHSDQLYIRLPSGLRLWQIVLAVVFSVLSLWALLFPGHYFNAMYDMDGSSFTFPIRLYACALICISVMYWSTVHAADRDVIRMILLSSVVFFTLQSGVMVLGMLLLVLSVTKWTMTLLGLQCICVLIGYFFHCGMMGSRTAALKRTTSNKDLCEKDQ